MTSRKKKTLILNTLTLILCVFVVGLFCISPKKEQVLDKYKVVFDTAGGNYIEAMEIEEGNIASAPSAPTREGYEFVGWMLGDELYDFSEEVSGDITLKAEWRELIPEVVYHTIDFNSAGGSTVQRIILAEGSVPTEPAAPIREGFEFVGWYYNDVLFDFSQPLNQDYILNAQWVEVKVEEPEQPETPDENKTYTVKFNLNGGSGSYPDQTVKAGEKAKNPGNPTRSGYTFDGWRLNRASGSRYNFNNKVNSNITLYAAWKTNSKPSTPSTPTKYTIRFLNNDGTPIPGLSYTVNAGANVPTIPAAPQIAFHSFDGFFTAQSGGERVSTSTKVTRSMDFYARYTERSITVGCKQLTNDVQGAGLNCRVSITVANNGYLPSSAGFSFGQLYYTNGGTISIGGYKAARNSGIKVCESKGKNCHDVVAKEVETIN